MESRKHPAVVHVKIGRSGMCAPVFLIPRAMSQADMRVCPFDYFVDIAGIL